jgi:hypothetical protein
MSEARDPESNRIDAESAESVKSCPAKVTGQMAAHHGAEKAAQCGVQMAGHHGVPKEFQATTICGNCGTEFAPKRGASGRFCSRQCVSPGRSTLDENKIIELYASGVGIKTIAKRLLGRETAKNTIRDALKRNGVQIRTVQEMAKDPASILRRLIGRGVVVDSKSVFKKRIKTTVKTRGLELFDYGRQEKAKAERLMRNQKAKEEHSIRFKEINDKAKADGFKSEYHRRYKTEPHFRLKEMMRRRFKKVAVGTGKPSRRMLGLLGCTQAEFKRWIESQWEEWMTWENIGKAVNGFWQIDHIIPCSWFDQSNQDDLEICWHYLNLRPLCAVENNARRANPNKLIETIEALPSHPIKEKMIHVAISRSKSGSHDDHLCPQGRREPFR